MNDNVPGETNSGAPKTHIDPSLIWSAKMGFDLIHDLLHEMQSAESNAADLALRALWLAERVSADLDSALKNAETVVG